MGFLNLMALAYCPLVSIVLLIHICSQHPWTGNAPPNHAIGFIGISPPPGSLEGALLCCDGSRSALGRDASIIIPSAGHRRRWLCVPSSEPGGQNVGVRSCSCRSSQRRKESKRCAGYSVFKEQGGDKKTPHFLSQKVRGLSGLFFKNFSEFQQKTFFAVIDGLLRDTGERRPLSF